MITCYEVTPAERDDAREAFEAHHGATIDWNNAPDRGWVEGWVSAQRQCTNRSTELETHLRHLAQDYTRANIRIARLVEHVERLEKALSELSTIIDTMGDMPDGYIHPKPWRELYCEAALKRARAALEGKA
jgi:hypothetical protein